MEMGSNDGPGILMCCAVTQYIYTCEKVENVSLKDWIEEKCDIFSFQEEVKGDIRGGVSLVNDFASVECGEIRSSIEEYGEAVAQMNLRINLVKFVLDHAFQSGRFKHVVGIGHLFLECEEDGAQQNNCSKQDGTTIFVHVVH